MSTRPPIVTDQDIHDRVDEYTLPYRQEITRVAKEFRDTYERKWDEMLAQILPYMKHRSGCGVNAPRKSYLYARGCSCGLDELLDKPEMETNR